MGQKNLPLDGGEPHAKAFERLGWRRDRETQGKNPHIILVKDGERATLSIPNHKGKDVSRVIIAKLIALASITEQQYLSAYKGK